MISFIVVVVLVLVVTVIFFNKRQKMIEFVIEDDNKQKNPNIDIFDIKGTELDAVKNPIQVDKLPEGLRPADQV